jgi:hypothetical protein
MKWLKPVKERDRFTMNNLIYTDACCDKLRYEVKKQLGMDIILGIDPKTWTINDSLSIIMLPAISLAVINSINEITVLEMSLLAFMSKPILITSPNIKDYPVINKKIANYVVYNCDLRKNDSQFIEWFKNQELK